MSATGIQISSTFSLEPKKRALAASFQSPRYFRLSARYSF
jgi:hypothetical protein